MPGGQMKARLRALGILWRVRAVERQVLANEDSHAAREGQYARCLIRLEQQMPVSDVG